MPHPCRGSPCSPSKDSQHRLRNLAPHRASLAALGHLVPHAAPRCREARFPAVLQSRPSMLCAHREDRPCPVPRDTTCPVRPRPVSGGVDRLATPKPTLASHCSIPYKTLAICFTLSTKPHQQPSIAGTMIAHADRTVILYSLFSLSSSGFQTSRERPAQGHAPCVQTPGFFEPYPSKQRL